MREGAKVYVIEGLIIEEYEVVSFKEGKSKILSKSGNTINIDYNNLNADTSTDISFSKIVAYATLEEKLIIALARTRETIRKHRQAFHNTRTFEEFKFSVEELTKEEIQKEITDIDYHETYKEDILSDIQNE